MADRQEFTFGSEGRSLRQTVFELTAIIGRPDPMPNPRTPGRRTRPIAAPAARSLGSLIRLDTLDYAGLRGEGSIPVPLPPPTFQSFDFSHWWDGRRSFNKVGPSKSQRVLS
jgi:hypothetical protein